MNEWQRSTELHGGIRTRNYDRSLRALGAYIASPVGPSADFSSSARPSAPPPSTPLTRLRRALLQREHVCRLIDHGLSNHASRLDPRQWEQVKDALRVFDPRGDGAKAAARQSIELAAATFRERGGSYGPWNAIEAAQFEMWTEKLVCELVQYHRHCEVVSRA